MSGVNHYSMKAEPGSFSLEGKPARLAVHSPLADADNNHPFFALIGRVTAEWAQFEHVLDLIIWDLAKQEQAAMSCITGQLMGAAPRFYSVIALATLRGLPPGIISNVRSLMNRTFEKQEARNRITHDAWFIERGSESVGRYAKMSKKDLTYGIHSVPQVEIEGTIKDIRKLRDAASELRSEILAALSP